jgi:cell division protein FtsZ
MSNRGGSLTTVGVGQGKDRAQLAAQRALFCPELGLSIHGAQGILINIRAGSNLNLVETQTISNIIKSSTYLDAEYVLGVIIDESMVDEIRVSVLATGFSFENWEMEVKHVQPVQHKKPIVARQISAANSGSAASVVPIKKRIQDLSNLPIFAYLRSRLD